MTSACSERGKYVGRWLLNSTGNARTADRNSRADSASHFWSVSRLKRTVNGEGLRRRDEGSVSGVRPPRPPLRALSNSRTATISLHCETADNQGLANHFRRCGFESPIMSPPPTRTVRVTITIPPSCRGDLDIIMQYQAASKDSFSGSRVPITMLLNQSVMMNSKSTVYEKL